jgi:hypothetical protein
MFWSAKRSLVRLLSFECDAKRARSDIGDDDFDDGKNRARELQRTRSRQIRDGRAFDADIGCRELGPKPAADFANCKAVMERRCSTPHF